MKQQSERDADKRSSDDGMPKQPSEETQPAETADNSWLADPSDPRLRPRFVRIISSLTFFSFLASAVYVLIRIFIPAGVVVDVLMRQRSDYFVLLLICLGGCIGMLLPGMLQRRANIAIPSGMLVCYAVFLYCAIYLGEIRSLYYLVPYWDTVLHTLSGAALAAIGFSLVDLINDAELSSMRLSPAFVALFAFCFALTIDVLWEVFEFTADIVFGSNAQRYALEDGTPLVGQEALLDTMKDLIVDLLGALFVSSVGYVMVKQKRHPPSWFRIVPSPQPQRTTKPGEE